MKLHELLETLSNDSILSSIISEYPAQKESSDNYVNVLNELRSQQPLYNTTVIHIWKEKKGSDVYGTNGTKRENDPEKEESQILEFTPWEQWLGMEIDDKALQEHTKEQVMAHCLYEMTFISFSKHEIAKQREQMYDIVEKLRKDMR